MNVDLLTILHQTHQEIQSEYSRIGLRSKEDPGTAGDQGEENWAELLRTWLSPTFQIVTKGRIINEYGDASPQVDVLILRPEYPAKLLNTKLYLAKGVIAAFECKINLKPVDIRKVLQNSIQIKKISGKRIGSPYLELQAGIIYGLLSHSYVEKIEKSAFVSKFSKQLFEADKKYIDFPYQMLDLVTVANAATWSVCKSPISMMQIDGSRTDTFYSVFDNTYKEDKIKTTPIGSLLSCLIHKLAWEYPSIKWQAIFYDIANISGFMYQNTDHFRIWNKEIYSSDIRDRIKIENFTRNRWDHWNFDID